MNLKSEPDTVGTASGFLALLRPLVLPAVGDRAAARANLDDTREEVAATSPELGGDDPAGVRMRIRARIAARAANAGVEPAPAKDEEARAGNWANEDPFEADPADNIPPALPKDLELPTDVPTDAFRLHGPGLETEAVQEAKRVADLVAQELKLT